MDRLKKILKDNKLYIFLIITLAFFGIFSKMDFATDTYAVIGEPRKSIMINFLQSGRLITALCWGMICLFNVSINIVYTVSYLIAIIAVTLSLYKLFYIINNYIKNEIICILISTIIIINPFSIELFMYIEKGIMILGIMCIIYALDFFIKYLQKNEDKKNLIWSTLFMLLAVFCYQGIVALFIALSSVFVIKYSNKFKSFIKNTIVSIFIYGIPAIINFIIVKFIFVGQRVGGSIVIVETLKKLVSGCYSMLQTYNILPKFLLLTFLIIELIIIFGAIIYKKDFSHILKLLYVMCITILITILPQALQSTSSIWFVARSTYAFSSIIGIIALYYFICLNDSDDNKILNLVEKLLLILCILLLSINFYKFASIEIDHYNSNYLDKVEALHVGELIKEYEEKTGNKVTKISVYKDRASRYANPNTFFSGDINVTAFATAWSDVYVINYYNYLNLEKVDNDDAIKEKFLNENWTFFSEDQIIITNDTLHLCIY